MCQRMGKDAVCPSCHQNHEGFGEIDVIEGLALLTPTVNARGKVEIEWSEQTLVNWDSQRPRRPRTFVCLGCHHEFRAFEVVDVED